MPEFPIIDTHVHLYDVDALSYGWLKNVPKINRTYRMKDFDAAVGPVAIEKLVFAEVAVDPGRNIDEAAFVQGMADADPRLAGMIAHAPVEKGAAVEEHLEALAKFSTLRGIRRLMETEVNQAFALEPGFLEGVRRVGRHGLSFDICVKHWGLIFAIELAKRCPDVSFVLDHIGKPGIKHGLTEPWWSGMRELARLPNVVCKISGVVTEDDHAAWDRNRIKPYIEHAIECFGFDRVMFGSDWTVSLLAIDYPSWVAMVDEVVTGESLENRRKLYVENAKRVYRL
jgi:L-fuconolactonase